MMISALLPLYNLVFYVLHLPKNGSFAAQADAFADLLDEMNIGKVTAVGISAGGPSTLQFALRYPDRT